MAASRRSKKSTQKEALGNEVNPERAERAPEEPPNITVYLLKQDDGTEPFDLWFNSLRDRVARQRILARIAIVRRGSLGFTRPVGDGVSELKVDYGPGYRVYFGRKGDALVVLIAGGDKSSQQTDISQAISLWSKYKDEIKDI